LDGKSVVTVGISNHTNIPGKQFAVNKVDGCIVWNAHNTVLGGEALLI